MLKVIDGKRDEQADEEERQSFGVGIERDKAKGRDQSPSGFYSLAIAE